MDTRWKRVSKRGDIIIRQWRLDKTHEYAESREAATDCEAGRAYECVLTDYE